MTKEELYEVANSWINKAYAPPNDWIDNDKDTIRRHILVAFVEGWYAAVRNEQKNLDETVEWLRKQSDNLQKGLPVNEVP